MVSNINSSINLYSINNINLNNNNSINKNDNLVTDYSQAVSKELGYGVDKDGFFTSDFNRKFGIDNDIKINAQIMSLYAGAYAIAWHKNNYDVVITNLYKKFNELSEGERQKIANEYTPMRKEYIGDNGKINKSGEFAAFQAKIGFTQEIIGEETIYTKILKDSELSSFMKDNSAYFMGPEENPISGLYYASLEFFRESFEILRLTDKEEFKKQWLDFQKRNKAELEYTKEQRNKQNEELSKDKPTKRKPIQGKSDNNETYVDENINKSLQTLLESKFNKEKMLDILFGTNINNMNDDSMEIISEMNKNNVENKNNKKLI